MDRRILLLSKYPPLQGGIATRTYWLAEGLARRGWRVDIVTHPEEAALGYAHSNDQSESLTHVNVHVNSQSLALPWHIPNDPEHTLCMLERCLHIVDSEMITVVDSGYLVPYGIVASLLKQLRGMPHLMRHGGSDIAKFLAAEKLPLLLSDAVCTADAVVTDRLHEAIINRFRPDALCVPAYVPTDDFHPSAQASVRPLRMAFIGKVNYYRHFKRLDDIAAIMMALPRDIECTCVAQGIGLESFLTSLGPEGASRIQWQSFVHPGRMPALLADTDALFAFTASQPRPDYSNLVAEALCAGIGVVTDSLCLADAYADVVVPGAGQVLVLQNGETPSTSARRIARWLHERRQSGAASPTRLFTFDQYLARNESLYDAILAAAC